MNIVEFSEKNSEKEFIKATMFFKFNYMKRNFINIFLLIVSISLPIYSFYTTGIFNYTYFLIILLFPIYFLILFFQTKQLFRSSDKNSQPIYNSFDDSYYKATRIDFKFEMKINSIFKVEKTKNWIFIYTRKNYAKFIKLSSLSDENLVILKKIFDENKVKNNL